MMMSKTLIRVIFSSILALCGAIPQLPSNATSSPKIIGGVNVRQGQLPYQILLIQNGEFVCGGSLVIVNGKQIILTAAHCVITGSAREFYVVAGGIDRGDYSGLEQFRYVTRIIIHESYNRGTGTYPNDIAILRIEPPFELNSSVAPIPLPRQGQSSSGTVVVSGWGRTSFSSNYLPAILQGVQIPVVDHDTCRQAYSAMGLTVTASMICAGARGRDACQGDSGGPLVSVDTGHLAGIVSWGLGCSQAGFPGVNTRVSHFVDWINDRVQ